MSENDKGPSAYKIEAALSAWQSARARILVEDLDLGKDEAALTELLGDETQDVQTILARLLRGTVHAEAMAGVAGEQIEALKGRQTRFKARGQSMRTTAFQILDAIGQKKVELPDLTASIAAGKDSVFIVDPDQIPDVYVEIKTTRTPDKTIILADLKAGREVPGCFLGNGASSIRIRTR